VTDDVSKLLARGGRAFGLAAVAHARGQRAGQGPWHALSRDAIEAAERILDALEGGVSPGGLAAAIAMSMGDGPATAEPAWTRALVGDPASFARIGRGVDWPNGFPIANPAKDAERGIALVALALCRSVDAARALGGKLPGGEGEALVRWARLMQAVARPGEPSAVRGAVRGALEREDDRGVRD
jgi:hypothetical protein